MLARADQVADHVEELLDLARVECREVEAVAAAGRLPNLGAKLVEQAATGVVVGGVRGAFGHVHMNAQPPWVFNARGAAGPQLRHMLQGMRTT